VHFSLESKESDGDKSQLGNVTLQFLIPGTSEPVSALVRIHVTFLCVIIVMIIIFIIANASIIRQ